MTFNMDINLCDYAGIYSITTTIDNRFYIGSTVNLWRRYKDHNHRLKNKIHANKYMQAFSNKYGLDKFSFNLLYVCKNTCLRYNEKLWIDILKPQFNIKPIIERPYFEDEIYFNIQSIVSPLEQIVRENNKDNSILFFKEYSK